MILVSQLLLPSCPPVILSSSVQAPIPTVHDTQMPFVTADERLGGAVRIYVEAQDAH